MLTILLNLRRTAFSFRSLEGLLDSLLNVSAWLVIFPPEEPDVRDMIWLESLAGSIAMSPELDLWVSTREGRLLHRLPSQVHPVCCALSISEHRRHIGNLLFDALFPANTIIRNDTLGIGLSALFTRQIPWIPKTAQVVSWGSTRYPQGSQRAAHPYHRVLLRLQFRHAACLWLTRPGLSGLSAVVELPGDWISIILMSRSLGRITHCSDLCYMCSWS